MFLSLPLSGRCPRALYFLLQSNWDKESVVACVQVEHGRDLPELELCPLLDQTWENLGQPNLGPMVLSQGVGSYLEEAHPKGQVRVADNSNDYRRLYFSKMASSKHLQWDRHSFHQEMGLHSSPLTWTGVQITLTSRLQQN